MDRTPTSVPSSHQNSQTHQVRLHWRTRSASHLKSSLPRVWKILAQSSNSKDHSQLLNRPQRTLLSTLRESWLSWLHLRVQNAWFRRVIQLIKLGTFQSLYPQARKSNILCRPQTSIRSKGRILNETCWVRPQDRKTEGNQWGQR